MTVAFGSAGTVYNGANGVTAIPYPSGISAGDYLVVIIGSKPDTMNPTALSGFATLGSYTGGVSATTAADVGLSRITLFGKQATGTESGNIPNPTWSGTGTANPLFGQVVRFTKDPTATWSVAITGGNDSNHSSTSVSVASGTNPGIVAGDMVLGAFATSTDAATAFSSQNIAATGMTVGTRTQIALYSYNSPGNDIGGFSCYASVTAGSATANPVLSATASTAAASDGPGVILRLREQLPNPKVETLTDNFSVDSIATKWPYSYGSVAISGGVATVTSNSTTQYSGLQTPTETNQQYSGIESYMKMKMTMPTVATTNVGPMLMPLPANGTDAKIQWENGTLYFGLRVGYTFTSPGTLAVAAGSTLYVGMGEGVAGAAKFGGTGTAGNLYFYSSTDGVNWTLRKTETTPLYLGAVTVVLDSDSTTNTSVTTYDDFNIDVASSAFTGTANYTGSGTLTAVGVSKVNATASVDGSGTLSAVGIDPTLMSGDLYIRMPVEWSRGTGTVTIDTPSNARVGDLLIYTANTLDGTSANTTTPAGFSSLVGGSGGTGIGTVRAAWKEVTSADIGKTWTFTTPTITASQQTIIQLFAVAGADIVTPFGQNEAMSLAGNASASSPGFPPKTATEDNSLAIYSNGFWNATSAVSSTGRSSAIALNLNVASTGANTMGLFTGSEVVLTKNTSYPTRAIALSPASAYIGWTAILDPSDVPRQTPGTAKRYYDTTATLAAIDAATTIEEINAALDTMEAAYGLSLLGVTNTTTTGTRDWTKPTIDNPKLKPAIKQTVDGLAVYTPEFISRSGVSVITFCSNITNPEVTGGNIGGFATVTQMFIDIEDYSTSPTALGIPYIFHHELNHVLGNIYSAQRELLETDWLALNPAGFTYNTDYANPTYTGEWPEGFVRDYARHSFIEDIAETAAIIFDTRRQALLAQMIATDPIIAAKVNLIKQWMAERSRYKISGAAFYTAIHAGVEYTGNASFTGSGSLSATGTSSVGRSVSLTGSGTLTVPSRTPNIARSAAFTGSGTLSASAVSVMRTGTASFSGSGTLSAASTSLNVSTTFTGSNGAPWPAPWTIGNGTATIQNNRGQQQTPATAWTDSSAWANVQLANGRVDATVQFPALAGRSMRIDVRFNNATGNGYRIIMPGDYNGFQLVRVDAWAETEISVDWTVTWTAATDYRVAFEVNGSTIRAKRWLASESEPTTWQLSATDTTYTTGDVRLVTVTSTAAAATALWDNVSIVSAQPVTEIANPERGFFYYTETHYNSDGSGFTPLVESNLVTQRTNGTTIVFRYYVIEKYRTQDTIDQAFLNLLTADFTAARNAGMKMVIRFAYSTAGGMTPPYNADTTATRTVGHIQQLAPVINANADIIDAIQAGFIGMWGEWYYTDNYGDLGTVTTQQWADRKAVMDALFALDSRIFILQRYVGAMRRLIDADPTNTNYNTRMGNHNDAFLASSDDYGTYTTFSTSYNEAQNKQWLADRQAQLIHFPQGGESAVANPPRSLYESAQVDLAAYRFSFLNPIYHQDVISSWGTDGVNHASARLGYRFTFSNASAVMSGSNVNISFDVTNDGWGAPYRNHPVLVDFVSGGTTITRTLTTDTRAWNPGTQTVSGSVAAPTSGTYSVHLRIVDPSASLQVNPLYSIRFANTGAFDSSTGRNSLGVSVVSNVVAASVTANFAGSGSLTGTLTASSHSRNASFTGSGTLGFQTAVTGAASAALAGSGTLSATSNMMSVVRTVSFAGSGTISSSGSLSLNGIPVSGPPVFLSDLIPGAGYQVRVRAVNAYQKSAWTSPVAFTAPTDIPTTSVNFSSLKSNTALPSNGLAYGSCISTFYGNNQDVNIIKGGAAATQWKNKLGELGPAGWRIPLAWNNGNPGSSAMYVRSSGDAGAYIQAIKDIGGTPIVAIGGTTNDNDILAADAANLVKFFNDNGGQNGGPVTRWIIGNEPDNGFGINNYINGGAGSSGFNAIATAMRNASQLPLTIAGPAFTSYVDTKQSEYNAFFDACGSQVDIVDFHSYSGTNLNAYSDALDWLNSAIASRPAMANRVVVQCGEVNYNFQYAEPNAGAGAFYTSVNTVFIASAFGRVLDRGGRIYQYSDNNGPLGMITPGDGDNGAPAGYRLPMPAYYGVKMWSGGDLFRPPTGSMVACTNVFPDTEVFASSGNKNVLFINKSLTQSRSVVLGLNGVSASGTYQIWQTRKGMDPNDVSGTQWMNPIMIASGTYSNSKIEFAAPSLTVTTVLVGV